VTAPERLAALQALPDEYLECRGYGHQWTIRLSSGAVVPPDLLLRIEDDMPPDIRRVVRRSREVTVRGWRTEVKECLRSGSTVLRLWDRGALVYEKRTWPDGYLLPAGIEDHEHYVTEAQQELWRRTLTTHQGAPP
jgi:hypothetical protein